MNGETEAVELLKAVKYDFDRHIVPASTEDLSQRLEPLSIGLSHQCPVLGVDARMFRIRPMAKKPTLISDVGEPPPEKSPIGRLNEKGQSVLYLADSPDSAFAERGAVTGDYYLNGE